MTDFNRNSSNDSIKPILVHDHHGHHHQQHHVHVESDHEHDPDEHILTPEEQGLIFMNYILLI